MSEALFFWPSGNQIKENSIIVIDAYGRSQQIMLKSNCQAYLVSGSQKVGLIPLKVCYGQFNLTQVILKPETTLTPGKKYELIIKGVGDIDHLLDRYNPNTNKYEKIIWEVITGIDTENPSWKSLPVYKDETWIEYGCGPAVSANFSFAAKDESEYLVKATVKSNKTNTESTYYLHTFENIIQIGHGMCSGEFYLENGTTFEVAFGLMDASGNEIGWEGSPLKFKCPERKGF